MKYLGINWIQHMQDSNAKNYVTLIKSKSKTQINRQICQIKTQKT